MKYNIIFFIFMIITTISLCMFFATLHKAKDLWFSFDEEFLWLFPIMLVMNITIWTITAYIRWFVMKYLGFNDQERYDVINVRDDFELEEFRDRFSKFKLKCIDGLCRKSNHIITSILNLLLITSWIEDERLKYQIAFCGQFLNILISYYYLDKNGSLAFPLYGSSSRIRDGKLARINLLLVRYVSLCTVIAVGSLMSLVKETDDEKNLLIGLIYIPTALGDAAGEIFGSLFGKHEFKVYGIGEVNKKSIEGTFAVFFFSIVPMVCLLWIRGRLVDIGLAFVLSSQSTVLELVSFRSTDNFVLPVVNALVVYAWTQ